MSHPFFMSTPIQAASAAPTPEIHPLRWNLCRLRRGTGRGLTVTYEAVPIKKITQTKKAVVRGDDGQLRLDKKADQVVVTTSPNPLGFSASSKTLPMATPSFIPLASHSTASFRNPGHIASRSTTHSEKGNLPPTLKTVNHE